MNEEITTNATTDELDRNNARREKALGPVVDELKALNKRTEAIIQLLCDLLKR